MIPPLFASGDGSRLLLIVAAPLEARAVAAGIGSVEAGDSSWVTLSLGDRIDLLETGVGKVNAAGALAAGFDPKRHGAVINLGIAGACPGGGGGLCDIVFASESVYADEGVLTPDGFVDLAEMGFPPVPESGPEEADASSTIFPDPQLRECLLRHATLEGVVATVSTCSGTDEAAADVRDRTGAIAEAMEGAAIGFTLLRLARMNRTAAIPFAEMRVISNTAGDRDHQEWDLDGALLALRGIAEMLSSWSENLS